jgi:RNA polymerase sigma factor (sigma-70 family)
VDVSTIEDLYRTHGHSALRRARRLLGNEEEAREVLHEVFASLLDRPGQYQGASALTTWLYGATTHGCLNLLRNQRSRARLLAARSDAEDAIGSPPTAERLVILRDLLARVPEELARVAVYYYADEMTHDEIATVLACSRRHVGDLLERLHERMRLMEDTS